MMRKVLGFSIGIVIFAAMLLLPAPHGMTEEAKRTAAIALLMATFWIAEALPIAVTSLIPIAAFPLFSILDGAQVTKNYGDQNIYLFLGGFFIALAMERWNLHRRIALNIIKVMGLAERRIVLGFMCASALISMFISNTATTVMMLPVAISVVRAVQNEHDASARSKTNSMEGFGTALMLGVAYSASIGGIGTLIGTAPNIILAGAVRELFPGLPEITFSKWLFYGIPLVLVFIPLVWLYLTLLLFPPGKNVGMNMLVLKDEIAKLGKITKNELLVLIVFVMAVVMWVTRSDISIGSMTLKGWESILGVEKYVHDSTVSIFAAVLLFMLPAGKGEHILSWEEAKKIPWGVLLLFGGGFALAEAFQTSGLSAWIGESMACMKGLPLILIVVAVITIVIFLTELTSNTALTVTMMPIMASLSSAIGVHPFVIMIPTAIAASCAFMLPVATPPNAIVFSSGYITIPQMAKAGFLLNITGIVLITLLTYFIIIPAFHI
ncbi:MAG: DASS family sodium-coupled anion symporter [Acidobacteriota bacterium]